MDILRICKKVSVTGAGCLQECKNTEFVSKLRKTGFCEGSCIGIAVHLQEHPLGELLL